MKAITKIFLKITSASVISFMLAYSLSSYAAESIQPFYNFSEIVTHLGLQSYYDAAAGQKLKKVKVAILDRGFAGVNLKLGAGLPSKLYAPLAKTTPLFDDEATGHGTFMSQLVYQLMTNNEQTAELNPQIFLYRVTGYSSLQQAVANLIKNKVDIVVYGQVWPFGNNMDGGGFWNAEVAKATKAGVLWINAAGNFGRGTFNTAVLNGDEPQTETVVLEHKKKYPYGTIPLSCSAKNNPKGECAVDLVLVWNDYDNDPNVGTDKDLNLVLYRNEKNVLKEVGASRLTQAKVHPDGAGHEKDDYPAGYTRYARERIAITVKVGDYNIGVDNISKNFEAKDHLRIMVQKTPALIFPLADQNESILNPADFEGAITVGASDTVESSVSANLGKPELRVRSEVYLYEDEVYKGVEADYASYSGGKANNSKGVEGVVEIRSSSFATAMVGAMAGILKAFDPNITREEVLNIQSLALNSSPNMGSGSSLEEINFDPTGVENEVPCFERVGSNEMPKGKYIREFTDRSGAVAVWTKPRHEEDASAMDIRFLTAKDPLSYYDYQIDGYMGPPQHLLILTPNPDQPLMYVEADAFDPVANLKVFETLQVPNGAAICGKKLNEGDPLVFVLPDATSFIESISN
jgi:hypothetical protein